MEYERGVLGNSARNIIMEIREASWNIRTSTTTNHGRSWKPTRLCVKHHMEDLEDVEK
jgi:hypothetical protein